MASARQELPSAQDQWTRSAEGCRLDRNRRHFRRVRLHGNVKWKPFALVCLAIFWVWSSQPGLVEAAKDAIAMVAKLFGNDGVAVTSYQALTAALVRYTPQLLPALWGRLQSLMHRPAKPAGASGNGCRWPSTVPE